MSQLLFQQSCSKRVLVIFISLFFTAFSERFNLTHSSTVHDFHLLTALTNKVEPGYNDLSLYDISAITSDMLWYQLIRHC
jgi:hypothetical protein